MTTKREKELEAKRAKALAMATAGGAERAVGTALPPDVPAFPASVSPRITAPLASSTDANSSVPSIDGLSPHQSQASPLLNPEILGPKVPPPDEPAEEFKDFKLIAKLGNKRLGLKKRGWLTKNTFFDPQVIQAGDALAADLGIEWSEVCNLALAIMCEENLRSNQTQALLKELRYRTGGYLG